MRKVWKWLLAVALGSAFFASVGTFVYIHVIEGDAPAKLTLSANTTSAAASTPSTAGTVDGTWKITTGSLAGYRVGEVLFGQSTEAVGRTSDVTGSFVLDGNAVTGGTFTVDMTTVTSNQTRRDNQFNGRIMNVAAYPTATFRLTKPIDLGSLPADGEKVTTTATGELTLHGTTKTVTVPLDAQRKGATIEVASTIPVTFADWNIPNPSFGPAQTEDHGTIELLLVFARQ